jgi:DNA-binding GntR family transcriptional regulator
MLTIDSKENRLHRSIYETLRDRIVHGEYPPGMGLSEKDLCREFGVSRTPLREALAKLESMKLVTIIPRFGTHVSPIDINEIRCAFEVKIKLESLAVELAVERIDGENLKALDDVIQQVVQINDDDDQLRHQRMIELEKRFHHIILQAAQNPILAEFLDNLHYRCARLWSSSLSRVVPNEEILDQMKNIYRAIAARDAESAGRYMKQHIQYFIEKIKMRLL